MITQEIREEIQCIQAEILDTIERATDADICVEESQQILMSFVLSMAKQFEVEEEAKELLEG